MTSLSNKITLVLLLACIASVFAFEDHLPKRRAFVTVLQDENELVGLRTLAFSLQQAGNTEKLVVLYTPNVRTTAISTLDTVLPSTVYFKQINPIVFEPTGAAFNLLHLWAQTDYDRIIYIDLDAVVVTNIKQLFLCGKFCAVNDLIAPEHFNIGMLVITPSAETFQAGLDYLKYVTETPQPIVLCQQSFLNRWLSWSKLAIRWVGVNGKGEGDLADSHAADAAEEAKMVVQPQDQIYRLDTYWNALAPLYYGYRPAWNYNAKHMKIAAYDFPKPWLWYTYPVLDLNYMWYNDFYAKLPYSSHITMSLAINVIIPFALAVAVAMFFIRVGRKDAGNLPRILFYLQDRLPASRNRVPILTLVAMSITGVIFDQYIQNSLWDPHLTWLVLHGYLLLTFVLIVGGYSLVMYCKAMREGYAPGRFNVKSTQLQPITTSTNIDVEAGNVNAASTPDTNIDAISIDMTTTTTTHSTITDSDKMKAAMHDTPCPLLPVHLVFRHDPFLDYTPPVTASPLFIHAQLALLVVLPVILYTILTKDTVAHLGNLERHVMLAVVLGAVQLVAWFKCFREFPMYIYFHTICRVKTAAEKV